MPESFVTGSILTSLNAQEPWPDNVKLFQPYEVEQILLPDNASCLAVQAFLKMCNLPFEVEMRWNAEFMSPSGRVPFIKCGAFVVSELEPIVQFAANKGVTLCSTLSAEEKAEMRAYMSLITNVLVNAELYISWLDDETYNAVTRVRNSSVYPWPLGWLQTRSKRNAVAKRLKALNWGDKTLDQVLADVEQCCNSLSQRLGERDYFFGTTPTPIDALVYGHMRALLAADGPKAALFIKPMTTSLLKHVLRISQVTGMKLMPQEDYLLTQAFRFTHIKLSSDRNSRLKRSKLCVKNESEGDMIHGSMMDISAHNQDIIAFKPFASKQAIIKTANHGDITFKYKAVTKSTAAFKIEEKEIYTLSIDIIEDILDKVEEIAFEHLYKLDDQQDFEIIYPQDEKFSNVTVKVDDIDMIEGNNITDMAVYSHYELFSDVAEEIIEYLDTTEDNLSNNNPYVENISKVAVNVDDYLDTTEEHGLIDNTVCNVKDEYTNVTVIVDDYLDTIEENDITDTTASMDLEDKQNTSETDENNLTFGIDKSDELAKESNNLIKENHLEDLILSDSGKDTFVIDSDIDSSKHKELKEEIANVFQ